MGEPIDKRLADVAHNDTIVHALLTGYRRGDVSERDALIAMVEHLAAERTRLRDALAKAMAERTPRLVFTAPGEGTVAVRVKDPNQ